MTKLKLMIVIASTRPGRVGLPIAQWFRKQAEAHDAFEVTVADLAEINLPFMNEPKHPRLGQYIHAHTKAWSAQVAAADAFVFVTPEYNYSMNAPLKNAIDYLFNEWQYKPVGFVSYGGASGGVRAVQMIKQVVTTLKMVPVVETVALPFVQKLINEDGQLQANEAINTSATTMLNELHRMATALEPLRMSIAQPA